MQFVQLSAKDADSIVELEKLAYVNYDVPQITKNQIENLLSNGFILGIEDKRKLLSCIQIFEENNTAWSVWGIATLPGMQGKGLADKLLKRVIELAKEKGTIKKITTTIRPGNERSLKLFSANLEIPLFCDSWLHT